MKIVQVTPRYPPRTGGVETHVRQVSERLVERGHEVTVLTADAGEDVPSRSRMNGVTVRRHRGIAPGGAFHVAPGILTAVRRIDADVVHAHNYHAIPLFFAAVGITGERFVVTTHYHGTSANKLRNVLLSGYRPFGQWAVRRADEIIAVSEWEQERLREDFGVEASMIPNGVDVGRFADAEPERRDRPYLLCVGRLEEYKGVQHVVRALTELPEYDLVVAGSGPYRDELEGIAREADVSDRVDFLGYVDDERIPRLYAGATVYLTLSKFEAYGMTVSEALSAETPCVVREAGALQDWARRDGVIGVSKPSPLEISAAVRSVVGRSPSGSISTWNDAVTRLVEIYGEPTKHNRETKYSRDITEEDDSLSDDID